jgi:3-oxoacyl-[acyl-carrier-protein] synthase II
MLKQSLIRGNAMKTQPRVAITGMGVFASAGQSVPEFFDNLVSMRSGISNIEGFPVAPRKFVGGQIKNIPLNRPHRVRHFARRAIAEALKDSKLEGPGRKPIALFFATVAGDSYMLESRYGAFKAALREDRMMHSAIVGYPVHYIADSIGRMFNLTGQRDVNINACASGNIAIGRALAAIRSGKTRIAIVCGAEQLRPTMYWGAERAGILGSRILPFHKHRDGTVLGDGAACVVLEEWEHAVSRRQKIHAELVGYGISCADEPHEIIPQLDGSGVARSIVNALRDGRVSLEDVGYINAHATGTRNIEISESAGIRRAFGSLANRIPVSSTKSYSGHLSSASAVLEVVATVLGIEKGFLHPTLGLDVPDEDLGLMLILEPGIWRTVTHGISLSMGAGGICSAVVISSACRKVLEPSAATENGNGCEVCITGTGAVTICGYSKATFLRQSPTPNSIQNNGGAMDYRPLSETELSAIVPEYKRNAQYNRAAQIGLAAASNALKESAMSSEVVASERFGVIVGTALGGTGTWSDLLCEAYQKNPRHITPSIALNHGAHLCATLIARKFRILGPTVTLAGGVNAGISAVAYAVELLSSGALDGVLVCGTEIADWWTARGRSILGGAMKGRAFHACVGQRPLADGAAAIILERWSDVESGSRKGTHIAIWASESFGNTRSNGFSPMALRRAITALKGELSESEPSAVFLGSDRHSAEYVSEARTVSAFTGTGCPAVDISSRMGETAAAGPLLSIVAAREMLLAGRIQSAQDITTGRSREDLTTEGESTILITKMAPGGAAGAIILKNR